MAKRLKLPGLALLLGILGAAIRRWHILTAFEGELGLCDPNATSSWAMAAFFFLAGAVLLLSVWRAPVQSLPEDGRLTLWDAAFAARGDTLYLTAMVLAGFATLAAAPFLFREAAEMMAVRRATGEGDSPLLQLILTLSAVPGGIAPILCARSAARMRGRAREDLSLLFPGVLSCVWLLEGYRANAADPVLWDYVPLLAAILFGLIFRLACAGMAFGKGRPRLMLWSAGMTAAVSGAVLGGLPALSASLLLAGQLLSALAALWVAPGNLERMPDPSRFGTCDDGPDTDETEDAEPAGGSSGQDTEWEDNTNGQ